MTNRAAQLKAKMATRAGARRVTGTATSVDPMHRRGAWAVDTYMKRSNSLGWGSRRFRPCDRCGELLWDDKCVCRGNGRPSSYLGAVLNRTPADFIQPGETTPKEGTARAYWEPPQWLDGSGYTPLVAHPRSGYVDGDSRGKCVILPGGKVIPLKHHMRS